MNKRLKISEITSLNVSQCLTLELSHNDLVFDILLTCYAKDQFAAYLNQCPHTGVNLNWQVDQCFDSTEQYLSCSMHGALFRPDDGVCIYGPCVGKALKPITLEIEADDIFVSTKSLELL